MQSKRVIFGVFVAIMLVGLSGNPLAINPIAGAPFVMEAYAESIDPLGDFENYTLDLISSDGIENKYRWSSDHGVRLQEYDEIQEKNIWINFKEREDDTNIYFEGVKRTYLFNKNSCALSTYEGGELIDQPLLTTQSHTIKESVDDGLNVWNVLAVNDAICEVSYTVLDEGIQIVSNKGDFKIIYDINFIDGFEWTYQYTNKDITKDNHKYGFTFVCDGIDCDDVKIDSVPVINDESKNKDQLLNKNIKFGNRTLDLKENTHGYTWAMKKLQDKTVIDFTHSKGKLALNETLEVDPTFQEAGDYYQLTTDNGCNGIITGDFETWWSGKNSNTYCYTTSVSWDLSTIPAGAEISDVDLSISTAGTNGAQTCTIRHLSGNPSTQTNQEALDDVNDGTAYVSGNTSFCQGGASTDEVVDLGATAVTDFITEHQGDQEFGLGFDYDVNTVATAVYYNGLSDFELVVEYTYAVPPNAVDDLTSTSIGLNSIDLDWTEPNLNGETLVGYQINYTTPQSSDIRKSGTIFLNNTGTIDDTVTGLIFGTDYSFTVSAWTVSGNNATFANVYNATTVDLLPPTSLTATATSVSQINLEWTAPATGGTPDGYKIERESPVSGGWSTLVADTGTTDVTYSDTGLNTATQYNYRVSSLETTNTSISGNEDDATTLSGASQPTGLVATSSSESIIGLDWDDAPSYDNIQGFRLFQESPTGDGSWTKIVNDTGSSASTYSVTSLAVGTQFNYMVAGINATSIGSNSTSADAYTYFSAPTSLNLIVKNDTAIDLDWIAPIGDITGYQIFDETPTGGGFGVLTANTTTSLVTYNVTGLLGGTEYNFKLHGWGNVTGLFSLNSTEASGTTYTPAGAPTSFLLTPVDYDEITITWNTPASAGTDAPITGYKIECESPVGNGFATIVADTGLVNTYSYTGLTANTEYNCQGYTLTASTQSLASTADDTYTLITPITDLSGSFNTPVSIPVHINMTWTETETPTGYGIFRDCGAGYVNIENDTASTTQWYDDVSLCASSWHAYYITAWNTGGESLASNIINVTSVTPITGSVTLVPVTHTIGDVMEMNYTAVMDFAYPPPTINSLFISGISGSALVTDLISLTNDTYTATHRMWPTFDGSDNLKATLSVTNATGTIIFINSTSESATAEYEPDFFTSVEGSYQTNYTMERDSSGTEINLKINRDESSTWQAECNFRSELFGDGDWINLSDIGAYEVNQSATATRNTYVQCYNDELLFTTVSFGEANATTSLVDFTDQLGSFFGVPIPFLFVVFIAAIFTGRSAPTGIIVIAGSVGVMGLMGYFPDPTDGENMVTATVWGMIILITALGIFMGKRFF